ncbi:hypothetical protein TSOC_014315 [Tetrabaena socialis]|uniref:Protein kinase domain-containing protein n=1 Tax=Tetrabaena socialis TaxID=47790 RepID=A0A2J7ZHZ8_9CHLO|nr:hypothetical protein TSOC_014315 [Tetrabaena socialis]|eukprot:PNG99895.1 hypothetical protein TSOC_014315 [Tetrabaena socialis]
MPVATTDMREAAAASSTREGDFLQPAELALWEIVDPGGSDEQAQRLDEAIIGHQEAQSTTPSPRLQPHMQVIRRLNSEADVVTQYHARMCQDTLEPLVAFMQLPRALESATWSAQPPAAVLAATLDHRELLGDRAGDAQSGDNAAEAAAARLSRGGAVNSRRRKADLVLEVALTPLEGQQLAAAGSGSCSGTEAAGYLPAGKRYKVACVGEAKRIPRLMVSVGIPVDLMVAYHGPNHGFHRQAREVIGQIYTYLLTWSICHGFITCWNVTWLVYLGPDDRKRMHVSQPYLATTGAGATMAGAMSWHQLRALLFICEGRRVGPPPSMATGSAAAGGGQGASGGGDHGGHGDADDDSGGDGAESGGVTSSADPTYIPSTEPTSSSSSALMRRDAVVQEPCGPSQGSAATTTAGGAARPAPVRLCFLDLLAQGGDGIVFHGTCDGAPAVIKVFTWELCALAAYWQESVAYRALTMLQGSVVPLVLAHGKLPYGLRYIALRPIEGGEPLSGCLQPFPRAVAVAALRALQEVQAACPGFVHGDVRLENLLLVRAPGRGGAAEGEGEPDALGGAALRCVLLDFARSRMDGSEQQQQRELAQLRQLLGNAAGE